MKFHNFYARALCLLLIIGAVLSYNFIKKHDTQADEISQLTERLDDMEDQQEEMLTALQDAADAYEEAKTAAEKAAKEAEEEDSDSVKSSKDDDASESKDSDSEDEEESDNYYTDGTYSGEAQGFGGAIQVDVTLKDDEITDIQITSASGEDSAYLSQAKSVIDTIISEQSTDVDTVSGATFSSTGIINAVIDALGKAESE